MKDQFINNLNELIKKIAITTGASEALVSCFKKDIIDDLKIYNDPGKVYNIYSRKIKEMFTKGTY